MNTGIRGLAWCFTFVILEAAQAVFFGGVFQRMDAFLVGSLVFGLSTAATLAWMWAVDRSQLIHAFSNRAALVGMNISAAGGWLAYLTAIQLVEPAVCFAIFSGAVPLATLVAARCGVAEATAARNRLESWAYVTLLFGLLVLVGVTVSGNSGFVRGGLFAAMAGLALSAVSGALIAVMLFYCRRLDRAGVGPVAQFGLRFLLYIFLSIGAATFGLDAKGTVTPADIALVVFVGLLIMAFPIYAMQKAVSLVSPLTIGAVTALGPLFVFVFQFVEGRVAYSPATMLGLGIYFVGAIGASLGAARVARAPYGHEPAMHAGRISGEGISDMVNRHNTRLALDEVRSGGKRNPGKSG